MQLEEISEDGYWILIEDELANVRIMLGCLESGIIDRKECEEKCQKALEDAMNLANHITSVRKPPEKECS